MPPLTREELAQMMQENMDRMETLFAQKSEELLGKLEDQYRVDLRAFQSNYGQTFNVTTCPQLPRGSVVMIDLSVTNSSFLNASGLIAKYFSTGKKYVEEWVRNV